MDGHIGDFLDASLSKRQMESFPTPKHTGYTQGASVGISAAISDIQIHARQMIDATQNITDQTIAIKANSQKMGNASTQARSVSLGLSKQAETIDGLLKSFLADIRNL